MLLKAETAIGPEERAPELSARLSTLGAALLLDAIRQVADGSARPEKQNDADATLAPILKKEDGLVDWRRTARQIYDRWRGFDPWPGAYTSFRGQRLSLLRLKPAEERHLEAGELRAEKRRLFAGFGEGSVLEIVEIQLAGRKSMSAEAFLNGYPMAAGERLGDLL
jgi:methionyl-tRNA formyltransferase